MNYDYYAKSIRPFINTIYYEMGKGFEKKYIWDTYKQLLEINKIAKKDLSGLEKNIIEYCMQDVDRVVNLTKEEKE